MSDTVTLWPLVGRDQELASFAAAWAARHCRGVVVCGPAGIGKTRLAEEFMARAVRAGFVGGQATASVAAAAVPLGAIAHLIPPGLDLSDPVRGFAAVARALSDPRGGRNRVLFIDDLQWLDAASATMLRQLLDAGVVRLIGTVRTGEPVGTAVAALCGGDAVHRIDLSGFNLRQTELALRAALGGPVVRRTVQYLHARSGGNILFLRELVLGALAAGVLADDGEIWELTGGATAGTPRLSEMISARLASAPHHVRPVLELLALCEPLPLADVEAAADLDAVTALEGSGLVQVRTAGRRTTVTLAHPLYGESLRENVPPSRRRRLLIGQIERTLAAGARRGDDTRRIAAWQLAATGTADPSLLIEAAATARYAHDYVQARTLLEALREEDQTAATRIMLGEVLFELGDPEAAEAVLAVAAAEARNDADKLAVALTRTLNLFWHTARTEEALALAEKVKGDVSDAEIRRMLRHHEASMRLASGDPAAMALLDDMPVDVRDAADPAAWLSAALMKPIGLSMAGRAVDGLDWAERAYQAHLEVADRALYPHPASHLISVSMTLRDVGRLAEARAAGERAYAELGAAAAPLPRTWIALCVGQVEWLAGHPASAREWFAEAVRQARNHGHIRPLNPGLNGLAIAAALLGDVTAARQAAAEARRHPPMGVYAELDALSGAWLLVARGDVARARALLAEAADRVRATGNLLMEAWLLIDLARLGAATQAADRLAEIGSVSQGQFAPAAAGLARALRADDPEQLLASSCELADLGADLYAVEAASAAAAALDRDGRPRQAQAAAQRAQRLATQCENARTPLSGTLVAAPLTARQREIATLAAAGTMSKDIAGRLQLSVRTVENHLQNAYATLGVTSRAGLADALAIDRVN
jgi:DNA-binding CsgD family transcriptional regulator